MSVGRRHPNMDIASDSRGEARVDPDFITKTPPGRWVRFAVLGHHPGMDTRLAPLVEVAFPYDATVRKDGILIRDWVKDTDPNAKWNPSRKTWSMSQLGLHPGSVLESAGFFDVLGPDGHEVDLSGLGSVLVTVDKDLPGMVAIYPRFVPADRAAAMVPDTRVWQEDKRRWVLPVKDVAKLLDPFAYTSVPLTIDPTVHEIDLEAVAAQEAAAAASSSQLVFDATLDGLRGIPVTDLRSVDSATARAFEQVGVTSLYELLHTPPRRYIDRSNPVPVAGSVAGDEVAFIGVVRSITAPKGSAKGKGLTSISVEDTEGTLVNCRWFNAAWVARRFHIGSNVVVFGTIETWAGGSRYGMTNPLMDPVTEDDANRIGGIGVAGGSGLIPIYPQSAKAGLSTWQVRRATAEAVERMGDLSDPLAERASSHSLANRTESYSWMHAPDTPDQAQAGRDRLAWDELTRLQLSLLMDDGTSRPPAVVHKPTGELTGALRESLPWPLTGAQDRALSAVTADMASDRPMHRLVQGDVGSGKTLVALASMLVATESGQQAVLMAPTEILAAQHFAELSGRVAAMGRPDVVIELLTNKVTGAKRKAVLAGLADGSVDMVVGTHALLSKGVEFHSLSLVVIDEQHRFGVEQRQELNNRSAAMGRTPDMMVMTATPVPRTAVLTSFGDLDVSVLDELPPGRTPIKTILTWRDEKVWEYVEAELAEGRQAFVVAPLVTDSETRAARGAEELAAHVGDALPGRTVDFVHGKQKGPERTETMKRFERGELDVLVATTVIEVGVNVPNATVMVITGAEDFGLAQLHQLRGRVGRGKYAGTCFLMPSKTDEMLTETGRRRLEAMVETTDGFVLSQRDLEIRGPGTLIGSTQSGAARDLRVADLMADTELIEWARADAAKITAVDPSLARHPVLRSEVWGACGIDAGQWLRSS